MNYKDLGLVNTKIMFADALKRKYAIPAFNFYNMETLKSILDASENTKSPVILAVSESALKYMGDDFLMGMISGAKIKSKNIALHLDHGHSFESCKHAIDIGFSSVMFDGSELPFSENVKQTKKVVNYAKKFNVSVEAELGTLSGIEDENTKSDKNIYTNPSDVINFVHETDCDSLAIAIGTSHGAYKRNNSSEKLRFDILDQIAQKLPKFPLVLHGSSNIPQNLIKIINKNGGKITDAMGIPAAQVRRAVSMNICKVNVDSDARLAFTAAIRESLFKKPENFDPRKYLTVAMNKMTETYIHEITEIMNSAGKAKK
ncbi:MAG: ketose-bisphosphate aldolase [Alphaproteobacteria bacterium]|nr:ketose-bisphosphate aldolase [Alphaproteobacteria bacterium]MBN2675150.1 ketose-bisphosphate aldolase [Alphaproteobacteria bacterium]